MRWWDADRPGEARLTVGLEQGADGTVLAHGLNLPGCAAWGRTAEEATEAFARELRRWLGFLASVGEPVPPPGAELAVTVEEWLETGARVGRGESTACFADDLRPLDDGEIERGLRRLTELRGVLLGAVRGVPEAVVDRPGPGGHTPRRVLEELARAQWWTLSRLGATPMAGAPDRTLGRLDTALALVVQHLGHLAPERRAARIELEGEEWTPRKVLRRLLWLEWTLGRAAVRTLDAVEAS